MRDLNIQMIKDLNRSLSKINGLYQKWSLQNDMNSCMVQTMYAIYMENEMTQKEICENYQLPRQTVNNTIKLLEHNGHVKLMPFEKDKRWKKIVLTDAGSEYIEREIAQLIELDLSVVRRMGKEKICKLVELLHDYADSLEQETGGK